MRLLVPKSPRTKRVSQSHHWTTIGWFEPERLASARRTRARSPSCAGTCQRIDRYANEPERDERRDEQHRNRRQYPAHEIPQHRPRLPLIERAHHNRPSAMQRNATSDPPLIDVPEHAFDRVVRDRTDHLVVPDRMSGSGSSGSATSLSARMSSAFFAARRAPSSRSVVDDLEQRVGRRDARRSSVVTELSFDGPGMFLVHNIRAQARSERRERLARRASAGSCRSGAPYRTGCRRSCS